MFPILIYYLHITSWWPSSWASSKYLIYSNFKNSYLSDFLVEVYGPLATLDYQTQLACSLGGLLVFGVLSCTLSLQPGSVMLGLMTWIQSGISWPPFEYEFQRVVLPCFLFYSFCPSSWSGSPESVREIVRSLLQSLTLTFYLKLC